MAGQVEREGGDVTYKHMCVPEEEPSEAQSFYEGSVIFITGASGFLGNLLLEKLIRSCTGLSRIYVLIRAKKEKQPEERFEEMFKDVVFERMRLEQPKYYEKISLILGDCGLPGLGISDEDKQILTDQVDIVFHIAATVRLDEKLRRAVAINVRGTRDLLQLSRTMKNLKAFIHISTAYSHCTQKEVHERFYNTDMTGDKLISMTEILDDDLVDLICPTVIGKWPNTYTYTKAVAENIVREYGRGLPVSIIRPSIVISTAEEPVAGWINNYYGPVGITVGASLGILRTMHCNPENIANIVPADFCVNLIIVSAWLVGKSKPIASNKEITNNIIFDEFKVEDNMPIFNCVSSSENPLNWKEFKRLTEKHAMNYPTILCMWYYCFYLNGNKYVHQFCVFFLHLLPGLLVDTGLLIMGKKPMLLKIYKKIHKFSDVLKQFTIEEWIFCNNNTQVLWKKLNCTDKKLFRFSNNLLCWDTYFSNFSKGVRVYLLKDPLDTLPQGKAKYRKLKIAHYALIAVFYFALFNFFWIIIYPHF